MGIKAKKKYRMDKDPIETYTKIVSVTYTPKGAQQKDSKFRKVIEYEVYDKKGGKMLFRGGSSEGCDEELGDVYNKAYNKLKEYDSFEEPIDE